MSRKPFSDYEDRIIDAMWSDYRITDIAAKLNRPVISIRGRAQLLCLDAKRSMYKHNIYSLYKGGKLVYTGTAKECAEAAGITTSYFRVLLTPSKKQKQKMNPKPNMITAERVEENKEELA